MADRQVRKRKRGKAKFARTKKDDLIRALEHPLRRQILLRMRNVRKGISARQIAEDMEQAVWSVTYHLGVLLDAGAIKLVDTKPVRGTVKYFYGFSLQPVWAKELIDEEKSWESDVAAK